MDTRLLSLIIFTISVLVQSPARAQNVNWVQDTAATTGNSPAIVARGTDSNVSLILTPKGTGSVGIGTTSPQSLLQINGGEVQIGSSGASCVTANAGAMRYASGTMYYCNGSAWNPFSSSCLGGSAGSDTSLASGLVAYWNFNENTGITTYDDTGNGNNGSFNGATGSQWVNGKIGHALSFDGSDNYVLVVNAAPLDFTNTMSISAWVYPLGQNTNSTDVSGDIVSKYNSYLLWLTSSNTVGFGVYGGTNATTSTALSLNTWHHVVATFNSSLGSNNIVIYTDGALATTQNNTSTIATNSNSLLIGSILAYGNQHFNGYIDEVGIWNVVLTSAQVSTLYNSGSGDAFNATLVCPVVLVGGTAFAN